MGPPPTTRFLPAMRLVGGAWKSHKLGPLVVARGLGMSCCALSAAAQWVLTADHLATARLVGHLLLRNLRGGRVGRGAGAILREARGKPFNHGFRAKDL